MWLRDLTCSYFTLCLSLVFLISHEPAGYFPNGTLAFSKVLAKLFLFLECFYPLETLLKPKATPLKKNHLLQETSDFIMIYFVLVFTWHMCYF